MTLRDARRSARLTQEQLGERLGISASNVSRHEKGELRIPDELVRPWLDALGVAGDVRVALAREMTPSGYLVELGFIRDEALEASERAMDVARAAEARLEGK